MFFLVCFQFATRLGNEQERKNTLFVSVLSAIQCIANFALFNAKSKSTVECTYQNVYFIVRVESFQSRWQDWRSSACAHHKTENEFY